MWADLPANELLPKLVNDLEPAAFAIQPQLREIQKGAEALLCRPVRMSGSGSTLFTLFDDRGAAEKAATIVMEKYAVQAMALRMAPSLDDDLRYS
jgi:4-diphosphocytidyl-2C-methyl-D-erythritol kinase